jgi:tetratricopeptide (TPR) repeat protein
MTSIFVRGVVLTACMTLVACAAKREAQWDATRSATNAAAAEGESAESMVAEGDAAWANRDDQASVEAALAAWEKAVALDPSDVETHTKLARGWFFLADAHMRKLGEKSEQYLETFEKGVAASERALGAASPEFKAAVTAGEPVEKAITKIGPDAAPAAYWYAASLGKWARAKGFATTLGNKDKIKSTMERVLEVAPDFFYAAPDRYFGAYYSVAPGFAGGDVKKSRAHFEKSLHVAPNYAGTKVLMADTYATKVQDRALFEQLLDEVLAMPDDAIPGLEAETRVEKQKAQELKARIKELF